MAPGNLSPPRRARGLLAAWAWVLLAFAIAGALVISDHRPQTASAALSLPVDGRDTRGPLDLTSVALVQRDVRLSMRITTVGSWSAKDVVSTPGRALCVSLVHGSPAITRGRVCVARRDARPALSYTPLSADGTAMTPRRLAAAVTRPSSNTFEATFLPVAAALPLGRFAWFATSAWTDQMSCLRACEDRLPDGGLAGGSIALLGVAPCFGAAARDPQRPCDNPDLRLSVEPPVQRANDLNDPYCDTRENIGLLSVCAFGAAPADATDSFALIGDSHAGGLKSALAVVTLAKRWRGISLLRPGCPATQAASPILPTAQRSRQCATWNRQVLDWLGDHRDIDTVFISAHATATVAPAAGEDMATAVRAGYRDELRALLRLVPRVVVIRDVPFGRRRQLRCIDAAVRAGQPPGPACALPRADVVPEDPMVAAALALDSSRIETIDLTDHFCDALSCFPVVGGALVQRDESHLTATFSATLGPYIVRALDG